MIRLLLIAAIAAVAWYLFRRLTGGRPAGPTTPPPGNPGQQGTITRCAECGIHAPEASGVRYHNLFFCSPEHLNDYLRKGGSQ